MQEAWERSARLFGEEKMNRLEQCHVAVFGIGGVGGYVAEALVRGGVGALTFVDHDTISLSNLNRQIIATQETIGRRKVEVMAERARSINPAIRVSALPLFYTPETQGNFDFSSYDYVVDAIDTVSGKLALAECCRQAGTPLISCMGAGNKLDPSRFEIADLFHTSVCPLARVMRTELRKRGFQSLQVVYSTEVPLTQGAEPLPMTEAAGATAGSVASGRADVSSSANRAGGGLFAKRLPGSNSFVPAAAGLVCAGAVIRDLAERVEERAIPR